MSAESSTLVLTLKEQWSRTWAMWEDLIESIPEEEWRAGDLDYLVPARHLIHVAIADDFFASDTPPEDYDDFRWFKMDDWETLKDQLPSKKIALETLVSIKAQVLENLDNLSDEALLESEMVHTWTGATRLGKWLYNLRHIQHHLGEVNAEIIRRGMKGVAWK